MLTLGKEIPICMFFFAHFPVQVYPPYPRQYSMQEREEAGERL
jgi:hypothetical protein